MRLQILALSICQSRKDVGNWFEFAVKEKPKPKTIGVGRDPDTIDMFVSMTDAQINMFGNQLSRLPEFSNLADGNESYDALASRIKDMLKDPEKQKIFIPHLRKLDLKPPDQWFWGGGNDCRKEQFKNFSFKIV
jgi:hypothetical protein